MKKLFRCAGSSLAAVAVEFALLTFLGSIAHVFYLVAVLAAGVAGICVSFVLNRRWAFVACHAKARGQMVRHALVVIGGIALGMGLTWLLVSGAGMPYQVGWLGGGAVVFFVWTFPMQRFFAFRVPQPALA